MKVNKIAIVTVLALGLFSCSSYTEEQGEAADSFCECMESGASGDFDIDFFECTLEQNENYDNEIFADEGYGLALDEKCPDIAAKITE